MNSKLIIVIISICLSTTIVKSQTNLSGTISNNTRLTIEKSPYILTGTLGVPSGITLTIDPGVTIKSEINTETEGSENTSKIDLLIKGELLANGKPDSIINFSGPRIMFKSSNLSNSEISNVEFDNSGIQLADEREHNQDNIKNSNSLILDNCTFKSNSYALTKGYDSYAYLIIKNSTLTNTLVKGYYPRSETIELVNCDVLNSTINSDSYNKGITVKYSMVKNSKFTIGCCGANINIIKSKISNSPFSDYNNYYDVSIDSSIVIHSPMQLNQGNITINNSLLLFDSEITSNIPSNYIGDKIVNQFGLKTQKLILKGSSIIGTGNGIAVELNPYSNNNTLISNSTFSSVETSILINRKGATINNSNFFGINKHTVLNKSSDDIIASSNWWGSTNSNEIAKLIYDTFDNINSGKVEYSNFLTTPDITAPISQPTNVFKSSTDNGVIIKWNSNPESDISGYKIHYNKIDEFTYSNTIDVGNVTTYEIPNIDLTKKIVF